MKITDTSRTENVLWNKRIFYYIIVKGILPDGKQCRSQYRVFGITDGYIEASKRFTEVASVSTLIVYGHAEKNKQYLIDGKPVIKSV